MITKLNYLRDSDNNVQRAKPGEVVRSRTGDRYTVGRGGELRLIRAVPLVPVSPSRLRRQERRAAELAATTKRKVNNNG